MGAVLGAIGGLLYSRSLGSPRPASEGTRRGRGRLDRGRLLRLAWSLIGVVRQILALD